MTDTLTLGCHCGTLSGVAMRMSPEAGNHIVCYCDDCQAFARFLGRDDIVDAYGGTEIFQTTPARVKLTAGVSNLRCMRLSTKGLFRWYAGCCRTPVGNTLGVARMPFVGLIHSFIRNGAAGRRRADVIGPIVARVHGRFAIGGTPPGADATASLGFVVRTTRKLLLAAIAGEHKPSPFFDERGKLVVTPDVLGHAERARLSEPAGGATVNP